MDTIISCSLVGLHCVFTILSAIRGLSSPFSKPRITIATYFCGGNSDIMIVFVFCSSFLKKANDHDGKPCDGSTVDSTFF